MSSITRILAAASLIFSAFYYTEPLQACPRGGFLFKANRGCQCRPGCQLVDFQWKFEKGKTFYQEMTFEAKQNMKVTGMDVVQTQNQTFFFSWTPMGQDKDCNWIIKQKIDGFKMDIDIGGNKVPFDTTKDAGGTPFADFCKMMVDSEFTLKLSPKNDVLKIEGREEFLEKLLKASPEMKPFLDSILSDEALKQMADPAFAFVPGQPVTMGESWTKTSRLNMGPIGTFQSTYLYTYEGKVACYLERIYFKTDLRYSLPTVPAGGLPFTIKKADLKRNEGTGAILFDNCRGRLVSSEMQMTLDGTLTIDIGGTETEVVLVKTQKTTVKIRETNPLEK